jgi:hypothetical protein
VGLHRVSRSWQQPRRMPALDGALLTLLSPSSTTSCISTELKSYHLSFFTVPVKLHIGYCPWHYSMSAFGVVLAFSRLFLGRDFWRMFHCTQISDSLNDRLTEEDGHGVISKQLLSIFLALTLVFATWPLESCKKSTESAAPTVAQAQAPATTYAVPTADQLYQLVAPIALFPDNLVAQVLAASTYPDQITAAYAWLQQNSNLKGDQLMQAADQQPWDASVKGLTQFPDVLNQMASSLSWTSALGDAYFNIPQSVMNAVQVMRQRAQQAGNLKTNAQQNVTVENQPAGAAAAPASSNAPQTTVVQAPPQTIIIQPAQPQVVYVPTYNPTVVYGAPVAAYPGYSSSDMALASVISFGVGIAVGAAIANNNGCCGWGWNSWGCGWHNSTVVYNRNTYISTSNTFVNRNNYYNRNVNVNNINRNNINVNNVNRNNINRNNVNQNNFHANNFNNTARNSNFTTPNFNQKYNQPQFNNSNNRGNLGQSNRVGGSSQPTFNQQNRAGLNQNENRAGFNQNQNRPGANQNQSRPNNLNQTQRESARGYGQQANRGNSSSAFSNYSSGGNARVNSARGQQSLAENRAPAGGGGNRGSTARPQPRANSGGRR